MKILGRTLKIDVIWSFIAHKPVIFHHNSHPCECIYPPMQYLSRACCCTYLYTLGKKGCYTPIEDNKTNVDRTFVFPLG